MGFAVGIMGGGVHAQWWHVGDVADHLRICCVRVAGVAPARASRLSQHVRETGDDCSVGDRYRGSAAISAHAAADEIY